MLHPSYMELIEHVNTVNQEKNYPQINSRYSLVMAAAKRARALVDKEFPMVEKDFNGRMLSLAIHEMEQEKIGIFTREPSQEEMEKQDFDEMAIVDLSQKFEDEE